jgi:hypothetical protein
MAISFVGAQGNAGATVTIPTHQSGDLILIFAYRDNSSLTPPSTPAASGTVPTWTLIRTGTGNTNAFNCRYAVATASTTTSGTWTNSTEIICLVYRGTNVVGANASTSSSGTTITFPALTLNRTDNTSWVVGFAGHRTATDVEQAPTGMTNRTSAGVEAAGHDTNGTVSSWSQQTVTVNASSGNQGCTVELRDSALTISGAVGTFNETGKTATLTFGRPLIAAAGAFDETGQAATLTYTPLANNYTLTSDAGTFTSTGQTSLLKTTRQFLTAPGTFTVSGQSAGFQAQRYLASSPGSIAVTGESTNLLASKQATGAAGSFTLSGQNAILTKGTVSQNYSLAAAVGAYTVEGKTAEVKATRILASSAAAFNLLGQANNFTVAHKLTAADGTYAVSGKAVGFNGQRRIAGDLGIFVSVEYPATTLSTRRLELSAAAYQITGQNARTLKRRRQLIQF